MSMSENPILKEIWAARAEIMEEVGGDVHAFFEYIREKERQRRGGDINLPPTEPEQESP